MIIYIYILFMDLEDEMNKILIVEDDNDINKLISEMLEKKL